MNTELLNQTIKTLESVRGALGNFAKAEVDLTLGMLRRETDEFRCPLCYDDPANIKPAQQQEPVTMDDAIAAGDSVLINEQAALLRECRAALDSLIAQKPTLAGLLCGSTTLGNLKAELCAYRPQGVFGTSPPAQQQEPVAQASMPYCRLEWLIGETVTAEQVSELSRRGTKLYTSPPASKPWVGLTQEQKTVFALGLTTLEPLQVIEDIEAKLKERNT